MFLIQKNSTKWSSFYFICNRKFLRVLSTFTPIFWLLQKIRVTLFLVKEFPNLSASVPFFDGHLCDRWEFLFGCLFHVNNRVYKDNTFFFFKHFWLPLLQNMEFLCRNSINLNNISFIKENVLIYLYIGLFVIRRIFWQ